jgi:tetratricopeptide (TPR) repeat protein
MPLAALPLRSWSSLGGLCLSLVLLVLSVSAAAAQDSSEPTRREKLMHYSLYYENYKNDDFKSARSDLLWILENAPGTPDGDDDNYRRAINLYVGLADQATEAPAKTAYLDTAATYLAAAPDTLDQLGLEYEPYKWQRRKGRFLEQYHDALSTSDLEGLAAPETHYEDAFELAPSELDPYYIQQVLTAYLDENAIQDALSFANAVEEERTDPEVADMIGSVREQVFQKNPQAQVRYLEAQVEQYPDSTKLLTTLFDAYNDQGNVDKAAALGKRLMGMEPNAETILEVGTMRLENGRPKAALTAYQRAADQGATLQPEDHFNRGTALQKAGKLSEARAAFRTAIDMQSDFGRAYIAIGDLYARAVNACSGGEMRRKDKAVYWAAVDKYREARDVAPALSSVADSKINTYRKVFPTKEDIFYREDWERGGSFTINYGCYSWIGETTSVRPSPSG